MQRSRQALWALVIIILGYLGQPALPPARASGGGYYWTHLSNLRLELAEVAKKTKDVLKSSDATAVSVGAFQVIPQLAEGNEALQASGSHGTGTIVTLMLTEELRRLGVTVSPDAECELRGDLRPYEDAVSQEVATLISVYLARGKPGEPADVQLLTKRLAFGASLVADLFGLTLTYPMTLDPKDRAATLRAALASPGHRVNGTALAAKASEHYAMEVLGFCDRQEVATVLKEQQGRITAELPEGTPFAVRLINRSNHAAAVTLSLNGLSNFTPCQQRDERSGEPAVGFTYVPARSSVLVTGWYKDEATEYPFIRHAHPPIADTGPLPRQSVTNVTAFFAAAWTDANDRPKDDPALNSRCSAAVTGPLVEYLPLGTDHADVLLTAAWERAVRGAGLPPTAPSRQGTSVEQTNAGSLLSSFLRQSFSPSSSTLFQSAVPVERQSRVIRREIGQNRVAISMRIVGSP